MKCYLDKVYISFLTDLVDARVAFLPTSCPYGTLIIPAHLVLHQTFLLRILTDIGYISHVKCVIYSRFVENISGAQFKIFRLLFEASPVIFFNNILG